MHTITSDDEGDLLPHIIREQQRNTIRTLLNRLERMTPTYVDVRRLDVLDEPLLEDAPVGDEAAGADLGFEQLRVVARAQHTRVFGHS